MFMIMPKPSPRPQAQGLAAPGRTARVKAACDRCRFKKIKCDGQTPCARCMHDQVVCKIAKKPAPADPLSASREYIQSLEKQQSSLVRALRRMHRLLGHPIASSDMKDIAEALKTCGFALDDDHDDDDAPHSSPETMSPRKRSNSDVNYRAAEPVKRVKYDHDQPSPQDLVGSGIAVDPALFPQESGGSAQAATDPFLSFGFDTLSPNSLLNYLDQSAPMGEWPAEYPPR